jgi:hypothetical protein
VCPQMTSAAQGLTLTCDGAVESVSLDEYRLGSALAVGLEHVDSLDGVLDLSTGVDRLDREHSVDSHAGEEVTIPARSHLVSCCSRPRFDQSRDSRSDDLAGHARLGHVDEAVLSERINLDGQLLREVPHGLLAREPVPRDDGRGVNLVLDEVVGALEQLRRDEHDRRSPVSDFLVLLLGELDEDAPGGVVHLDEVQDGRSVVGDGHVLAAGGASARGNTKEVSLKVGPTPRSSTSIESSPLGPRLRCTTLAMATAASTLSFLISAPLTRSPPPRSIVLRGSFAKKAMAR